MTALNLAERAAATDVTKNWFIGRPYKLGVADCGLMGIFHLKNMGWDVGSGDGWDTPEKLRRFLKKHGGSAAACLDKWGLERIAPARKIVGDILEMPSDSNLLGAFVIYTGNGRVLGFYGDRGACVMQPTVDPLAAWRA